MGLTISNVRREVSGSQFKVHANIAFDSSYATGGETLNASDLGLAYIEDISVEDSKGYDFDALVQSGGLTALMKVYYGASGTSSATSGGTPAGTVTVTPNAVTAGTPSGTVTATAVERKSVYLHGGATASASAQGTAENTDENAEQSGGHAWLAASTVAAGAWASGAITNPVLSRACCITIANPTGGALNLYEGVMTFTVTGLDYAGVSQTELITVTSTAGNKSVAAGKYRWKYGLKAFKTITTVTLNNVPADGLTIAVGISSRIFMGAPLYTPAEADVIQVTEDGSVLSITGNVDTTNMTFNHDALAANKFVSYYFNTLSGRTSTFSGAALATHQHADTAAFAGSALGTHTHSIGASAGGEVPAATDLSTLNTEIEVYGR